LEELFDSDERLRRCAAVGVAEHVEKWLQQPER